MDAAAQLVLFQVFVHLVGFFDAEDIFIVVLQWTVAVFVDGRRRQAAGGQFFNPGKHFLALRPDVRGGDHGAMVGGREHLFCDGDVVGVLCGQLPSYLVNKTAGFAFALQVRLGAV